MTATTKTDKPKKARKPKAKKTKSESLAEISELLGKIESAEEAVQTAELDWDSAREEAKTAKGVWLTRVSELRELVRTRKRWAEEASRQPLLNQAKVEPSANGDGATAAKAPENDEWKLVGIAAAGFSEKQLEALEEAGIATLGELQTAMARGLDWHREAKIHGRHREGIETVFNSYLCEVASKAAA